MRWLLSLLDTWFRRAHPSQCRDASLACERLKTDQRFLAQDIEALFRRFDTCVQDLALDIRSLSENDLWHRAHELRRAQDRLRFMLCRAEASIKQTYVLEQELVEWENCSVIPALHFDHPSIRAEIIRSELAVRDVAIESLSCIESQQIQTEVPAAADTQKVRESEVGYETIQTFEPEKLVQAIRDARREMERWHALPPEEHSEDAIAQVRHFRELHAMLKRIDHSRGITRDRLELA